MADDDRRTQNPLIAKLSQFAPLSNGTRRAQCPVSARRALPVVRTSRRSEAPRSSCGHSRDRLPVPTDAAEGDILTLIPGTSSTSRFLLKRRPFGRYIGPTRSPAIDGSHDDIVLTIPYGAAYCGAHAERRDVAPAGSALLADTGH